MIIVTDLDKVTEIILDPDTCILSTKIEKVKFEVGYNALIRSIILHIYDKLRHSFDR